MVTSNYTTVVNKSIDSVIIQPREKLDIKDIYDVDNTPEEFIPFITEPYNADIWHTDDPIPVQRNTIKIAYEIHQLRGTWEGLNRFATAAGFVYTYTFTRGGTPPRNQGINVVVTPTPYERATASWLARINRVIRNLLPMDIELASLTAVRAFRLEPRVAMRMYQRSYGYIGVEG